MTAVLDGDNFIVAAHMNLLHKRIEVAITYSSIRRYVQRFFDTLASHNIRITHVCFDGLKEPNKLKEYERRHRQKTKNRGAMYRWEFGEESSKKVKVYPMLWTTHWMFLECIAEIIGRENVHVGGKSTDVYGFKEELSSSDIARLCGKSSIVISGDSDFLLMPIRGVLPISEVKSRGSHSFSFPLQASNQCTTVYRVFLPQNWTQFDSPVIREATTTSVPRWRPILTTCATRLATRPFSPSTPPCATTPPTPRVSSFPRSRRADVCSWTRGWARCWRWTCL